MAPLVFDAFEFCRLRARAEGVIAVADLRRLASETVDASGQLDWAISGEIDERGHGRLHLSVSGAVSLVCQRCMHPMRFGLVSDSRLVLAKSEAAADELDAMLIDEEVEVIVGGTTFDAQPIIEDEALLALPASPRHEECSGLPQPLSSDGLVKESPFLVLKSLKKASS